MPYLEDALKKIKETYIVKQPGFYVMEIAHDSWCNILNGGSECNCNPDVRLPKKETV